MPVFEMVAATLELAARRLRQLEPPAPPVLPPTTNADRWATMLTQFSLVADRGTQLATWRELRDEWGVTRTEYDTITNWMHAAGVIQKRQRTRTRWAPEWNQKKFARYLKFNLLPPYPTQPAPSSFFRRSHGADHTNHTAAQPDPPLRSLAN